MAKVYTRRGDQGMTDLIGGVRISKADVRLEAYGTVDELSSHLGLLATMADNDEDRQYIRRIQNMLFNVGCHLATDQSKTALSAASRIPEGEVEQMEQLIDAITAELPATKGFILPGGCQAAAQAHVCRTVCRRAERQITALSAVAAVDDSIVQYMNRLSDYLFVLAKKINFNKSIEEILWQNACR
jgi:cob(I)alamin adenosyltransferase